jgi:hypothetical protein
MANQQPACNNRSAVALDQVLSFVLAADPHTRIRGVVLAVMFAGHN